MSVTPQVYRFRPGAKTGAAVVDGVQRCMNAVGTHHWEEVPGSYVPGVSIALRDILTLQRILTLTYDSSLPEPSNTVVATYSHDGGVTTSPGMNMTGASATYQLNSAYGMGIERAFVVEIEDAISIMTEKGAAGDGGGSLQTNALSMSVLAGRILSAHNKSDSENRRFEEGVFGGLFGASTVSSFYMLNDVTGSGWPTVNATQTAIWNGVSYVPVRLGATGNDSIDFLDKRQTAAQPILENVGDAQTIERLTPFSFCGSSSAAFTGGHTSSSRYFRARKYGFGDTPPASVPIDNLSIFPSLGDPDNIGWRHSCAVPIATTTTTMNLIHIWCPSSADEVFVGP